MSSLIVIGGGAAGIFSAIAAKEMMPSSPVLLLEKTAVLLAKVRVSGGGRCNVTHSRFDPRELVQNYPRGNKELLGPFHRFQPKDTIAWFEKRGVKLKKEADGRVFPTTDNSATIVQCLLGEAEKLGIEVHLRQKISAISKREKGFEITLQTGNILQCSKLILASGSSPEGYSWAESLGHSIQKPVPSLFTFNVPTSSLKDLSGISVDSVELRIKGTSFSQQGALLITHFGFSGPAAIKLSAWAARELFEKNYRAELIIRWLPDHSKEEIFQTLLSNSNNLFSENPFKLPKNLWKRFLETKKLHQLTDKLYHDSYLIEGKTTHKEEFVTCGGITLKEVDFKTMESKICPRLFFAGEILDVDGVTGGFNFQNAWTTGYLAGTSAGTACGEVSPSS